MATRTAKRAYDPRKSQVNILSVQSSKGLEFRSVIFIGTRPARSYPVLCLVSSSLVSLLKPRLPRT
jgi:ATP-dependent exoDNAse (exonuclease V) beta subunit